MSVRQRNGAADTRHRINQLREKASAAQAVAGYAMQEWAKGKASIQKQVLLLQLVEQEQARANQFERDADALDSFTVDLS